MQTAVYSPWPWPPVPVSQTTRRVEEVSCVGFPGPPCCSSSSRCRLRGRERPEPAGCPPRRPPLPVSVQRAADGVLARVGEGWLKLEVCATDVIRVAYAKDQSLLRAQEPGGGAEALRRREVGAHAGRRRGDAVDRRSCARASTWPPAACRSSTRRPARRSSKRRTAAARSCPRSSRARTRSTCGRNGSPTPARRCTGSVKTTSACSTSRATTSISGSTTARIVIPFLVSSRGWGILWDNTSFTRFGDLRELAPIPADRLYDARGKRGGLTGSYYTRRELRQAGRRARRSRHRHRAVEQGEEAQHADLPRPARGQTRQRALDGRARARRSPATTRSRPSRTPASSCGSTTSWSSTTGARAGCRGKTWPRCGWRRGAATRSSSSGARTRAWRRCSCCGSRPRRAARRPRRRRCGRRSATASTTTSSTGPSWTRSSAATAASPGRRR